MNPCLELNTGLAALFECSPTAQEGLTRVRTPFLYPDGDCIDLFIRERPGGGKEVSDLGETVRWLHMQTLSPRRTARQQSLIEDIALTQGIEFFRGQLIARYDVAPDLTPTFLRVAQAALRVSDLWFTFRTRAVQTVTDEVADFLRDRELSFGTGERLVGRSGKTWIPDFHVRSDRRSSLVHVLSTGNRAAARGVVNGVVTACYDLNYLTAGPEGLTFVSLFDDTMDTWTGEDYRLVGDISIISRWSRPDEFERVLRDAA